MQWRKSITVTYIFDEMREAVEKWERHLSFHFGERCTGSKKLTQLDAEIA
jgi:hypothetical protein